VTWVEANVVNEGTGAISAQVTLFVVERHVLALWFQSFHDSGPDRPCKSCPGARCHVGVGIVGPFLEEKDLYLLDWVLENCLYVMLWEKPDPWYRGYERG